ncbi:hypothetical protein [Aliarcobacter butzleri]|uniref:hypothetical protein n=1 Tax=Aliarcobacter butzleri TaxID=28197 RepID=UPI0021B3116F|nr:hypothetical protein [Aliarcobacter butzleri]MCT7568102.1 hypothetical protein [Aliarcobacter butzleri]
MEEHIFIDRYFESEAIILKLENSNKHNMTTFMNYLENLHSLADKLKDRFDCNIKNIPEFVILRIIRNYFHHKDDIQEYSVFVELEEGYTYENTKHLIISMKDFAKAIKDFKDNTKNKEYIDEQIELMSKFIDFGILDKVDEFVNLPKFTIDGKEEILEFGIDLFKYIYNISNIIADECREITSLKNKEVILKLEDTYTKHFNIGKRDLRLHPNNRVPIVTTKGFRFPKNRNSLIRAE